MLGVEGVGGGVSIAKYPRRVGMGGGNGGGGWKCSGRMIEDL